MKLEESNKDNAIKRYEAYVKGGSPEQACIIKMGDDPLSCMISGLAPSHDYTVGVKACVHGSNGCGSVLEKPFRTGYARGLFYPVKCCFCTSVTLF